MSKGNVPDISTMLRPGDRRMLDESAEVNWIPKNPKDLILPYMDTSDTSSKDRSSIEFRRKKAKEVYDGYGQIIENCKVVEDEIESQCKNVTVKLNPSNNLRIIEAVRRVFGTDGTEITFAMYKACVQALGAISGQGIPKPNGSK